VHDRRANGRKHLVSLRTDEVGAAREAARRIPRKCASLAQRIGVSTSNAWKICHDELLFPHKIQLSQPLSEDGMARNYGSASEC
jgi:hypothetical protein